MVVVAGIAIVAAVHATIVLHTHGRAIAIVRYVVAVIVGGAVAVRIIHAVSVVVTAGVTVVVVVVIAAVELFKLFSDLRASRTKRRCLLENFLFALGAGFPLKDGTIAIASSHLDMRVFRARTVGRNGR